MRKVSAREYVQLTCGHYRTDSVHTIFQLSLVFPELEPYCKTCKSYQPVFTIVIPPPDTPLF